MNRLATALATLLALAATSGLAAARDGCGGGFFWNGYQCAPMAREYYAPRPGYYGRPRGADCYYYYGRRICCPPHYTVQDGVCKPYRGG
jgi:hypothetical protein